MSTVATGDRLFRDEPPDEVESGQIMTGILSAIAPPDLPALPIQDLLVRSLTHALTGFHPEAGLPVEAGDFAAQLSDRSPLFRERVLQSAMLATLVEHPVDARRVARVQDFCDAAGVDDLLLHEAHAFCQHGGALAAIDFNRSGYTDQLSERALQAMHVHHELDGVWGADTDDPELAEMWADLEDCPAGSLGRGVWEFYAARGFRYPGTPGSAPPYLAQHDWVHVLADYGSTLESELEVFGFIGRASDDPRAYALLAMVVGLFETGDVAAAAGLFQADPGHLSRTEGMVVRLADAVRRGARTHGDQRLLERDWFADAHRPLTEVQAEIGVVPKSDGALAAGAVGPFEAGSLSPYQWKAGHELAAERGREYAGFGASPARTAP